MNDVLVALITRDEMQLQGRTPASFYEVVETVCGGHYMALAHQKTAAITATTQIDAADRAPRIFQGVDHDALTVGRSCWMYYPECEQYSEEEAHEPLFQKARGQVRQNEFRTEGCRFRPVASNDVRIA